MGTVVLQKSLMTALKAMHKVTDNLALSAEEAHTEVVHAMHNNLLGTGHFLINQNDYANVNTELVLA